MIRIALTLSDDEAAKLYSISLRSDYAGSQSDVMRMLARKVREALAEGVQEVEEPTVIYGPDLGGES